MNTEATPEGAKAEADTTIVATAPKADVVAVVLALRWSLHLAIRTKSALHQ